MNRNIELAYIARILKDQITKYGSKTECDFKMHKCKIKYIKFFLPSYCSLLSFYPIAKVTIRVIYRSREEVEFTVIHWTTDSAGQDSDVQGEGAAHIRHPLVHTAHRLPVLQEAPQGALPAGPAVQR